MKRILPIVIVLIVIAAIAYAVVRRDRGTDAPPDSSTTSTYVAPSDDSTGRIDRDLDGIDTGADLEADFRSTDDDIKGL